MRSQSQAYRKLRCPLRATLQTRANESGAAPLHLGIRFISELQLEDVFRYDCDSQKCDIALSTIPLRTFGAGSADVTAEMPSCYAYDLQSPVEADRTTCRDPAGPGPQTSPRGPGSRTAGLPGTNGVESPGGQARAWSESRAVLFQRRFSLDPLTGGADGLARVICALSHIASSPPEACGPPYCTLW